MKTPKAYYLDIDGTLTGKHNSAELNFVDVRAIKAAARDGAHIVLTTGRSPEKTIPVFKKIDIDKVQTRIIACNNGAVILNAKTGEILKEDYMREEDFTSIFNELYEKGYIVKNAEFNHYFAKENWGSKLVKKFTTVLNSKETVTYNKVAARKIGCICSWSNRKVREIAKDIQRRYPNVEVVISGNSKYIEITNKGVNKGNAIKFISELINVDPKDSVHIGDSMNDLPAFKIVGTSVALANGMKGLKKEADIVSKSQKNQGVASAIDYFRKQGK